MSTSSARFVTIASFVRALYPASTILREPDVFSDGRLNPIGRSDGRQGHSIQPIWAEGALERSLRRGCRGRRHTHWPFRANDCSTVIPSVSDPILLTLRIGGPGWGCPKGQPNLDDARRVLRNKHNLRQPSDLVIDRWSDSGCVTQHPLKGHPEPLQRPGVLLGRPDLTAVDRRQRPFRSLQKLMGALDHGTLAALSHCMRRISRLSRQKLIGTEDGAGSTCSDSYSRSSSGVTTSGSASMMSSAS
jgi:hypothetical protein